MALTPFSDDMDIIAKLADLPNSDGGLTSAQLKAKFDQGAKAIKSFLNNTLLAELIAGGKGLIADSLHTSRKIGSADFDGTEDISLSDIGALSSANGAVGTANLAGTSVTTEKLANNSVSAASAVSLTVAGWDSTEKTQTVSVSGMTADTKVIVAPAPASYVEWGECVVRCSAQGAGTLTFTCGDIPTGALTANLLVFKK